MGRLLPLALLAVVAFAAGVVVGARHVPAGEAVVERFTAAWQRQDYPGMYALLSEGARERVSRRAFARAYERAWRTATAGALSAGRPRREGDAYRVAARVRTRAFGAVEGDLLVPVDAGPGDQPVIAWGRHLVFPGLRPGERLSRRTRMPTRATLLARDNTPLARGAGRTSTRPALAAGVVGALGPAPPERRPRLRALGVPARTRVGLSGLERVFDEQLLGKPGGELLAAERVLRRSVPEQAAAVRTTISPRVQEAAVAALGPRLGGVVALRPRTGELLAFAGIAFSGLQPPGSTFKIVTATAGLDAGITSPSKRYPVQTEAVLEGVELENANGEACGGTLVESFAKSCNSVFAPMGAELGARRLVAAAERFGFNRAADLPGAATSTIPAAREIGDALAVGSSAIGQGRVQATALHMATIAATIGLRGRRPRVTLDLITARRPAPTTVATRPRTARTVERMMLAVVRGGTGTLAALPGVKVAGKTGTAELKTTARCEPVPENPESCPDDEPDDPTDTDAWFAAYAPAGDGRPKVAVGVLLVASGAGGDAAAPATRQVMAAALEAAPGGGGAPQSG